LEGNFHPIHVNYKICASKYWLQEENFENICATKYLWNHKSEI